MAEGPKKSRRAQERAPEGNGSVWKNWQSFVNVWSNKNQVNPDLEKPGPVNSKTKLLSGSPETTMASKINFSTGKTASPGSSDPTSSRVDSFDPGMFKPGGAGGWTNSAEDWGTVKAAPAANGDAGVPAEAGINNFEDLVEAFAASATAPNPPSLPGTPPEEFPEGLDIVLPVVDFPHLEDLVHSVVWKVGRTFGFQAFNLKPFKGKTARRRFVPASIFLASDHLNKLLVRNLYCRGSELEAEDIRFAKAVWELHGNIMYNYENAWSKQVNVPLRPRKFERIWRESLFHDTRAISGALLELALYFLIYTECANLRHCSETCWFIFWCMNHSEFMENLREQGLPERYTDGRSRREKLRNARQEFIEQVQSEIGHKPVLLRPEDCLIREAAIRQKVYDGRIERADQEMVIDLIAFGDGGFFMDRIVTPIFTVLAYEIDHLSNLGVEVAHRLGYDDVNECFCNEQKVHELLKELRVTDFDLLSGSVNEAYMWLTNVGYAVKSVDSVNFDPQLAADFWSNKVLQKTYRERRTWMALYRAFFRVYAIQLAVFHVMVAQAYAPYNWQVLGTVCITISILVALERFANMYMTANKRDPYQTAMTRALDKKGNLTKNVALQTYLSMISGSARAKQQNNRPRLPIENAPIWGIGVLEYWVIAAFMFCFGLLQFTGFPGHAIAHKWWLTVVAGYLGTLGAHFILTLRDGYTVSLTSILHLPALLRAGTSRPKNQYWLYGKMDVQWKVFFVHLGFWITLAGLKIPFDYFIVIRPSAKPVRFILEQVNFLACSAEYYVILGKRIKCIDGDWILVIGKFFVMLMVCIVDNSLFYQFTITIWGMIHGLLALDIGVVNTWDDLVREFYKGPSRFWGKCMSEEGNFNQRLQLQKELTTGNMKKGNKGVDNRALSDGRMFKVALVTPEQIHNKEGMARLGRVNMGHSSASLASGLSASAGGPMANRREKNSAANLMKEQKSMNRAQSFGTARQRVGAANRQATMNKQLRESQSARIAPGALRGTPALESETYQAHADTDRQGQLSNMRRQLHSMMNNNSTIAEEDDYDFFNEDVDQSSTSLSSQANTMFLLDGDFPAEDWDDMTELVQQQLMEWTSFAKAWDEIIDDLRKLDIINNKEMEMLKFIRLDETAREHGLRPILLPIFFFAGQIQRVVDTTTITTSQIMVLSEFRVLMVWLGCQLGLLSGKQAHVIMMATFYKGIVNVKHGAMRRTMFIAGVSFVTLLVDILTKKRLPDDWRNHNMAFYNMLKGMEAECRAMDKAYKWNRCSRADYDSAMALLEVILEMKTEVKKNPEMLKIQLRVLVTKNLAGNTDMEELQMVIEVVYKMLTVPAALATPSNEEAQRILAFFINSLSDKELIKPPCVDRMLSWSILTPHYEEDVLFCLDKNETADVLGIARNDRLTKGTSDLMGETEEGISLGAFLRATFAVEWGNFLERLSDQVPGGLDADTVTEADFLDGGVANHLRFELEMWASLRGQLLARTVRGMMCYDKALRLLTRLEYPKPNRMDESEYQGWIDKVVSSKFEYVVGSQTYGRNRNAAELRLRWLAAGVDILLKNYSNLKVSFLDNAVTDKGNIQYSVLVRGRQGDYEEEIDGRDGGGGPVEVYRLRMPLNKYSSRGVILGEGKPENQNHSIVFCQGEGVQAIDMNMENHLSEAFKMRNLLEEMQPTGRTDTLFTMEPALDVDCSATEVIEFIRTRRQGNKETAIVGFREWIFSGKAGALGEYAAAVEIAFTTIVQRTMTYPGRCRLHYGHPDMFNKLWVMGRGGISKGTRVLGVSEDVFAGACHTLRGAQVKYKEYISVGKGRDMGFDSVLGFQKKIAGGAGELVCSREYHRMGAYFDILRTHHLYYSGVGHYINNFFTVTLTRAYVIMLLLYSFTDAMVLRINQTTGGVDVIYLVPAFDMGQLVQLGTLSIIPYIGTLILEVGILRALVTVFMQFATGSLAFYVFQQQTISSAFYNDLTYGGVRYHATGRGFAISTNTFTKIYTQYARSHLYLGFEMLYFLTVLYIVHAAPELNYGLLTWNIWFFAVSLIVAPLWFNPFMFDLEKVKRDFLSFNRWLAGDVDPSTSSNWFTWNRQQLEMIRNDTGNNTDHWINVTVSLIFGVIPYTVLTLAAITRIRLFMEPDKIDIEVFTNYKISRFVFFGIGTCFIWVLAIITAYLQQYFSEYAKTRQWRFYRWGAFLVIVALIMCYFIVFMRWASGNALGSLLILLYANFNILIVLHRIATVTFTQNNHVRAIVDAGFMAIDTAIGYVMLLVLALLSFIGIVAVLQRLLLFNYQFSESVQASKVGKFVKKQATRLGLGKPNKGKGTSRPSSATKEK